MAKVPILENVVRQHAEMAAFLWTTYDNQMLNADENAEADEDGLADLVERLEAHIDGLRVAGEDGKRIAVERYREFPEAGELFVLRMLGTQQPMRIRDLDLEKVRLFITTTLTEKKPS